MTHLNRRLQLDAEFDRFLAENPDVYRRFHDCGQAQGQGV